MGSVSPNSDYALEILALYLFDEINAKFTGAVASVDAFDRLPENPAEYPHLCLYDTDGFGENIEYRDLIVRYTKIPNSVQRNHLPGESRSLQLLIAQSLISFDSDDETFAIMRPIKFEYRNRLRSYEVEGRSLLLPFFEIGFRICDESTLS